ncbi:MAG: hypothetical protein ABIH03_07910, partial [Pseudomonadota bacterium]
MADIVTIGMELDATRLVAGGKQAEQAVTGVGTAATRTESTLSNLTKTAAALGLTFGAYKAMRLGEDVLLLGARYETLGIVVDQLGRNVNRSATEMRALEGDLRKTGISMIETRSNIARMIQAEMDLTNATKLARVAQDAAVIGNINSSEAFASLVYGIQTGQPRILRTIGIMVQFEQAYKKAADTLGKTTETLTEQERVAARTNAVMEAGSRITGAYEAAMETAGKQLQSTVRYLEDAKVKVSEAFQPAFTSAVFAYANALKFVGEHAAVLSTSLGILMALLAGKALSLGAAAVSAYNVQLRAATVATSSLTVATTGLTTAAKTMWAALGGWVGVAIAALLTANHYLNKWMESMVDAAGMTEEEIALWEKTQKIWADRAAAQEAAAAAQAEMQAAAAKAQKELGVELDKQRALVEAFGASEHAMALLNLRFEEQEALAKNAENYWGAELKAMNALTAAIFEQRRALAELEEQKRRMERAMAPTQGGLGLVYDVTGSGIALEKQLSHMRGLLVATLAGTKALEDFRVAEAGVAAAAAAIAAGMPEAADRMRGMAEEAERIAIMLEKVGQTRMDPVIASLERLSMQIGGLAGNVAQVVTQFFLMAEAAQKAAEKADTALTAMQYAEAGAAVAGPAAAAMVGGWVFGQLREMFSGTG